MNKRPRPSEKFPVEGEPVSTLYKIDAPTIHRFVSTSRWTMNGTGYLVSVACGRTLKMAFRVHVATSKTIHLCQRCYPPGQVLEYRCENCLDWFSDAPEGKNWLFLNLCRICRQINFAGPMDCLDEAFRKGGSLQ